MNLDQTLLHFFNQTLANPVLDGIMLTLTLVALGVYVGIGVVLLWSDRYRPLGKALLTAYIVSFIWTMVFQFMILRPRPDDVRLIWPTPNYPSYPSGHSALAFAAAMTIYFAVKSRWLKWGNLLMAALIALSRVYLGHHNPSDILGGAILGSSVGVACYGLIVEQDNTKAAWRWLFWPQMALILLATQMAYLEILPLWLLRWPGADKVLHFILFGGMAFWLNVWLNYRQIKVYGWTLPLAIVLVMAYAITDEALQSFSPVRTVSLADLLSGLSGIIMLGGLSEWRAEGLVKGWE